VNSYKKGQISVLDYLNAIAANIEVTQYIDDDLVIDESLPENGKCWYIISGDM